MSAAVDLRIIDAREPARMPTYADLAAWDAVVSRREDSYELVEGIPTVAPGESPKNRTAGTFLAGLLNADRREWVAVTDLDVTLTSGHRPTVRRPDVVVVRPEVARRGQGPGRVEAGEVLFVAEVVSPSSVERDLVTKRREYAGAGIPGYLVVDLREDPGRLTFYARGDAKGSYAAVVSGASVTVTVDGHEIDIAVGDLLV